MNEQKLRVLLVISECNPNWTSVPLEGYKYFEEINKLVEVTLITHERNKANLEKLEYPNIVYIHENDFTKKYHSFVEKITTLGGRTNWPLYTALYHLVHIDFNQKVYKKFQQDILNEKYDIVHAITPMMPRFPFEIRKACSKIPFLLGPVNGGVPFPPGFQDKAREEFAQFNFLRAIGALLIPGYRETYKKADKVLVGSTYTLNMLNNRFSIDNQMSLFYENGIDKKFLRKEQKIRNKEQINLLFVGRLVPYKSADILIEAVAQLKTTIKDKIKLTIVGDGSERSLLEKQVQEKGLENIVSFTGWIPQEKTAEYYNKADIFGFPSIREFGGAVVLEAMACGLPCIVVNNGGIGEYVTEETGFKIEPISREYLRNELTKKIEILIEDENLWTTMSNQAIKRAESFTWEQKAREIVEIYKSMIRQKSLSDRGNPNKKAAYI